MGEHDLHRPRCCGAPDPEATWGLGHSDAAFITIWCTACGTDLVILDPPADGGADTGGEPTGTVGEPDIDQDREDLKGLTGIDRYPIGNKVPEGGRRSHGATSTGTRADGRFIAQESTARFWAKVAKQPGGCWLWTGATTADGYGRFRITIRPGQHRHVKAHRWAYEHLVGPIRPGYTLDHLAGICANKACVRPDHLEQVTRAENIRRAAVWRRANQEPTG